MLSAAHSTEGSGTANCITSADLQQLTATAQLADASAGLTQPHPNAACIIVEPSGRSVGKAALWAQGTEAPEVAAARQAGSAARGATAYLNLETGDCHGEAAGVQALLQAGVARVVVGLRHPLPVLRGAAIDAFRQGGVAVQVLGEAPCSASAAETDAALDAVLAANDGLLHRAVLGRPLGLLKYAMTLDGKIATSTGHSSWVSSADSRQRVFEARARSDAVIVGGQTVRRDNPRLTTRREGGHQPVRIVMSRTLDLPAGAALWDVSHAPTIVATQRGARRDFQRSLRSRGVEVLEFDFLTPDALAAYCYQRGFLRCLWECGGMLAAPAIAGAAIHQVMAFVAPKLIGGTRAPTPVGDLGFVEMTQALIVEDPRWQQVGPDLMLTGYLPKSGGLRALAAAAGGKPSGSGGMSRGCMDAAPSMASSSGDGRSSGGGSARAHGQHRSPARVVEFYKAWDRYGCLSNFSPHPVAMPEGPMTPQRLLAFHPHSATSSSSGRGGGNHGGGASGSGATQSWASVEHFYQAQKFTGVAHADAEGLVQAIAAAASPEEAARLGRGSERCRPELVRSDWESSKTATMHAALRAKFAAHSGPRQMLLSTATATATGAGGSFFSAGALLVEASPHDYFWGHGFDGSGQNMLGRLLTAVREELVAVDRGEAGGGKPAAAAVAAR